MMRDYTEQIAEFWPTIMEAWHAHANRRPVIECDLADKKVYTYDSTEYIDSLSERTRESTRRAFNTTMAEGGIMVFVKDRANHILQSYCFPGVGTAEKRKPNKPSQEIAHPRRGGKR